MWIVSWTSEEFVRTRNPELMLAGNGPYLVDRATVDCTGSASSQRQPGRGRPTIEPRYVGCQCAPQ
ncbi:YrhB domain-containing protein [Streptomyces sp. NPDC057694]|uniref:YrhB domain-containing protein n=1 Tax=Streptomyces sp. NPDC057694 TaxID=3346216 RepID=UPI0036AE43EC